MSFLSLPGECSEIQTAKSCEFGKKAEEEVINRYPKF